MITKILISILTILAGLTGAHAQDLRFFTIGTGGTANTYFPVGGLIANAISNPPGSRPCQDGGSCGVPGLIASAVSSRGSVDNIAAILDGRRESGLAQSDITYWAYSGVNPDLPKADDLRIIAALYLEHVHLVTLADSGIRHVADLAGRRVSLDEPGSGTFVDAHLILSAFGLTPEDLTIVNLRSDIATAALRDGRIEAFFVVAGYPIDALVELASDVPIRLVPLDGVPAEGLVDTYGFFTRSDIPGGMYGGAGAVPTLSVGAQWVTHAGVDADLIYAVTKALWNKQSRGLLDVGHSKGQEITLQTALDGVAVPLHAGAQRFYREVGMLK